MNVSPASSKINGPYSTFKANEGSLYYFLFCALKKDTVKTKKEVFDFYKKEAKQIEEKLWQKLSNEYPDKLNPKCSNLLDKRSLLYSFIKGQQDPAGFIEKTLSSSSSANPAPAQGDNPRQTTKVEKGKDASLLVFEEDSGLMINGAFENTEEVSSAPLAAKTKKAIADNNSSHSKPNGAGKGFIADLKGSMYMFINKIDQVRFAFFSPENANRTEQIIHQYASHDPRSGRIAKYIGLL